MDAQRRKLHVHGGFWLLLVLGLFVAGVTPEVRGGPPREDAVEGITKTLSAYRVAMERRDLEAMDEVFLEDALVFENGKREGLWPEYRKHHLGPEFADLNAFELGPPHQDVALAGDTAWVTDHFEFAVVTSKDERVPLKAAVTYILHYGRNGWRIAHMHWSSRRMRPATK